MIGQSSDFVHLHVHSTYSLLDAAVDIKRLINKAKKMKMPAIAITDHGNMFGAIEFYNQAVSNRKGQPIIKPIIGCEFYLTPYERTVKKKFEGEENYFHLIALARNQEGYDNLLKLCSTAYLDGFYYKPRIDKQILADCSEGLIASTACLQGEIPKAILNNDIKKAEYLISEYKEIFGEDNFFLELMFHGIDKQKVVNEKLIELSKTTNTPLIATNDVHYVDRDDYEAHDAYLCIGTGKKVNDENRLRYSSDEFYLKSPEEMKKLFEKVPDAFRNTVHIADRVSFDLMKKYPKNEAHLPKFDVPENYDEGKYLTELCYQGLDRKYENITPELKERLDYELKVIKRMRYPGYFLIVQDFINWARKNDISVGPGRGSAAGSLVAYTLGITDIDPLKYDLLFERFLNPDRVSMPDIDTDFEDESREKVIDYVREKYGDEKVCHIITFGTLKTKMAIRDVSRVLDIPISEVERITKLIPKGPKVTLKKAWEESPELRNLISSKQIYLKMYEIAKKLEGLKRNSSIHAAGIIIGDNALTNYVPLYKDQRNGNIATQFEGGLLEDCGLLKMDFLGLKNLSVIKKCVALIKDNLNLDINVNNIPLDDIETFNLLKQGNSIGVFQLESDGIRELLTNLKPDNFEEIIALIALYRPGPLNSGMDKTFIRRKFKKEKIKYPHKDLEGVLKTTYGVFIYQEQVMQIAQIIGNFTMAKADELRKAMGKKKMDKMEALRELFVKGAVEKGYKKEFAEKLYKEMAEFAEYGFNKSHSAAYAVITYTTAYLKAHYPIEYMCSLFSVFKTNIDDVAKYLKETKKMGIEVLAPDINYSEFDFSPEDEKIRFGLHAIQHVGETAAKNIVSEREENGKYKNLFDFTDRVDLKQVNKKVLEALAKAGAFESIHKNRCSVFNSIEDAIKSSTQIKKMKATGQMNLFGQSKSEDDNSSNLLDNRNLVVLEEWPENELLKNEKQVLGVYMTSHPLVKYEDHINLLSTMDTKKLQEAENVNRVRIAGYLISATKKKAKSGHNYAIMRLEDFEGTVECMVFRDTYNDYEEYIRKDRAVLIEGTIMEDLGDNKKKRKINVKSIKDLSETKLPNIKKIFNIYLKDEEIKEDRLHSLRDILVSHNGKSDVYFYLHDENNNEHKIRLDDRFKVSVNRDLKRKLDEHTCVEYYYEQSIVEQ